MGLNIEMFFLICIEDRLIAHSTANIFVLGYRSFVSSAVQDGLPDAS